MTHHRTVSVLDAYNQADIADLDAIAEYWQLSNDPANDFTPTERVELIDTARWCAARIARRADTVRRSFG